MSRIFYLFIVCLLTAGMLLCSPSCLCLTIPDKLTISCAEPPLPQDQDSTQIAALINRAKEHDSKGSPDSAEYYFKHAGKLAEKLAYSHGRLLYAGNYGVFLYNQTRFSEAMIFARMALEISQQLQDLPRMAAAYNLIALQHQALGRLKDASEQLIKALDIAATLPRPTAKDSSDRRKYLNNLSSLSMDLNDPEKGLRYARQSFEIARLQRDTVAMGNSLINIMVAEAIMGRFSEAIRHGHRYLAIGRSYNDAQMQIKALNNLGDVYRMQKRYTLSLQTFQRALALRPKSLLGHEVYTLWGISKVFSEKGDLNQAGQYFKKALKLSKTQLAAPQLIELLQAGAAINEGLGNYKHALELYRMQTQLKDSLSIQEAKRNIEELEIRYQTAEARNNITKRDLKILEQSMLLDKKNKWHIIFILCITILIITLVTLWLLHIQKQKIQRSRIRIKLIEAQLAGEEKEKARTAKELHDGVASILSAAKLHINALENIPYSGMLRDVSSLIDIAIGEIRSISHNLAPEIILKEGFSQALQSFCQRINASGFPLHCYMSGELPTLDKSAQLSIYRIIQECVTNMLKHADATAGIIQVMACHEQLLITIEDDGRGFDTAHVSSGGIGLDSLKARVEKLQGNMDIRSSAKGTSIFIEINSGRSADSVVGHLN